MTAPLWGDRAAHARPEGAGLRSSGGRRETAHECEHRAPDAQCRRTLLCQMRIVLMVLVLAGASAASIPTALTVHRRILLSDAILVARCRKARDGDWKGARHHVDIREVLENRSKVADLSGFLLDDTIPCTILGARAHVPDDRDVLLFVTVDAREKRLRCIYACMNSVIPLQGELTEYIESRTKATHLSAADLLSKVRKTLRELSDERHLAAAVKEAVESREPLGYADRGWLVARLARLRALHRGWELWTPDGTPPVADLSRRFSSCRPVFEWTGARATKHLYGVSRKVAVRKALTLVLRWRSAVSTFEIHPAPFFVEVRERGRLLWRQRLPLGASSRTRDTAVQRWAATFVTSKLREVEVILAFEDKVGAGKYQVGTVTVDRFGEAEKPISGRVVRLDD